MSLDHSDRQVVNFSVSAVDGVRTNLRVSVNRQKIWILSICERAKHGSVSAHRLELWILVNGFLVVNIDKITVVCGL